MIFFFSLNHTRTFRTCKDEMVMEQNVLETKYIYFINFVFSKRQSKPEPNEQTVTPPIPARLSVKPTSVLPVQYVKISLKYLEKHPPNKQILWVM